MALLQQMENDVAQVNATRDHVADLFANGFLFREEDGSIAMPENEEIRK